MHQYPITLARGVKSAFQFGTFPTVQTEPFHAVSNMVAKYLNNNTIFSGPVHTREGMFP
jgi:hypothetical protein